MNVTRDELERELRALWLAIESFCTEEPLLSAWKATIEKLSECADEMLQSATITKLLQEPVQQGRLLAQYDLLRPLLEREMRENRGKYPVTAAYTELRWKEFVASFPLPEGLVPRRTAN